MSARWLVLALVLATRVAEAGHGIIVLSDDSHANALGAAMQIALAGRGVGVATQPAPAGELRLERAAAAQRAALQLGADAAVWIDADGSATDVCVVSADGRGFRHAPLPPDLADGMPRAFSAIATSLLDELLASFDPGPAIDVNVDVHVDVPGRVAVVEPPPRVVSAPAAAPELEVPIRASDTLIEIGPLVSPFTAGIEAGVAVPLTERYRLGLSAGAGALLVESFHPPVYWGTAELRHVGSGNHHFDYGFVGGAGRANDMDNKTFGFGGMRFTYAWDAEHSGVSVSFAPIIASDGNDTVPAAVLSLRWELPL